MSKKNPVNSKQEIAAQAKLPSVVERVQHFMQQGLGGQASCSVKFAGKVADATFSANCKMS